MPVPERENCKFEGWYSDWHHEIQVADENGEIQVRTDWLLNDEFYDYVTNPEGYLYAKWSTKKQLPTYKNFNDIPYGSSRKISLLDNTGRI